MNRSRIGIFLLFLLFALDALVWREVFLGGTLRAGDYFLDVGQGDSELVVFPDGIKILTDAGPGSVAAGALSKILPPTDRYIDLAVISHPQSDHYGGFTDLLDHYEIGAFIWNGRDDDPGVASWKVLKDKIRARHIPIVILGAGDKIVSGAGEDDILSPDPATVMSAELNDTGFVERIAASGFTTLLTADIGANDESYLLSRNLTLTLPSERGGNFLRADVLKVAHHGSKYSSSAGFLKAVSPRVAVVEVGANNTYGHPASSTLARIASSTDAEIFRSDKNGTVRIYSEDGKLEVVTEKS